MSKTNRFKLLKELKAFRFRNDDISEIKSFFQCLDTPRSLCCWLLFQAGEHKQLVDLETNPKHYGAFCLSGDQFRRDFLATKYLSKSQFLRLRSPSERKALSIDKFFECEARNKETNRSIYKLPNAGSLRDPVILRARAKIEKVLGSFDVRTRNWSSNFDVEEWFNSCDWGPGVSNAVKGIDVSASRKYLFEKDITHDLYQFVKPLMAGNFDLLLRSRTFCESDLKFVEGSRIVTVPKNAKIDRVIGIEPGWNIYFQKGIGTMIRRRLRRAGIDLNTQQHNQRLARIAAKYGHLATVDFSSASDTISFELVRELLPADWFSVMCACRSPSYSLDGKVWHKNHKFSSMGNGYTFELESLIFYSIAVAVCELNGIDPTISVYGDDVIINVEAYSSFVSVAEELGFSVNTEKSFADSHFRESCGEYFFATLDCKPLFLKERLSRVESVFKLVNAGRRISNRWLNGLGCHSLWLPYLSGLYRRVPKHLRLRIPDGCGDGGFIGNFDEAVPSISNWHRLRHGWEGYSYYNFTATPLTKEHDHDGHLLARVRHGSPEMSYGNTIFLRNKSRACVSLSFAPQWSNLGQWY